MRIKDLNETLKSLLEGDVVSFADFKRQKEAQKNLDEALHISINKIKVNWCETAFGINFFKENEELSYEEFQKRAYIADYFLQQNQGYCKCSYEAQIEIQQGPHGEPEDSTYTGRLYLGEGKDANNILVNMEQFINENTGSIVFFNNIPFTYSERDISIQAKMYKEPQKDMSSSTENSLTKDYSNNGTKTPADVEVGDILFTSWGYDMTIVEFYRVKEKTKSSIKLEALQSKTQGSGLSSQTVIPIDKVVSDFVDGKIFRISKNGSQVCKIDGHYAYYWTGKPMNVNYYD